MPRSNGGGGGKGRRRRRILGDRRSTPARNARDEGGKRGGGVWYSLMSWFLNVSGLGGQGRGSSREIETRPDSGGKHLLQFGPNIAAVALIFALLLTAVVLLIRRSKVKPKAQAEHSQQEDEQRGTGSSAQRQSSTNGNNEKEGGNPITSCANDTLSRPSNQCRRTNNGGPSQVVAEGERRISLYDILTSDAPIPPHGDRVGTVPRPSRGISSPAGSRRASIFDRIADVVFNEEQKEKELVDVVAVREELGNEFRVTFREGAMGMTLSMEPGSRNAVVGTIVPHGQAYRAGVHVRDLVVGVGEHKAASYGTVLAFMNIMGRPIDLNFRKVADLSTAGADVGSDGGAVSTSRTETLGVGMSDREKRPEECGAVGKSDAKERSRLETSASRKFKASLAPTVPSSPISPRRANKIAALGQQVASSDSSFSTKMEHGVVVTKYGKKGAAAQKILFLDGSSKCVAWRDLDSRSPGHRRTPSLTNLMKGQRESLALAHLVEVISGDEPDPERPSEKGSASLREHCDESLLDRSFALVFRERLLEMTCDSHAEVRQLVTGFRDLQRQYHA